MSNSECEVPDTLDVAACYKAAMSDSAKPNAAVTVGGVTFANDRPIAVFAGPCQMESRAHALEMAAALKEIAGRLGLGLVYKTSFDKANRTSLSGKRGIGLDGALAVFAEIRETLGLPVVTDVHEAQQCARVAEVVDVLQIPAFLCRQTDLLIAAAKTGRAVKVKKGQFLAPWDMPTWWPRSPLAATPTCSSPSGASRSATTRWWSTCARCRSWPRSAAR